MIMQVSLKKNHITKMVGVLEYGSIGVSDQSSKSHEKNIRMVGVIEYRSIGVYEQSSNSQEKEHISKMV